MPWTWCSVDQRTVAMSGEMTKGHLRQWIVNPNYIFFEKETHTELLTDNKLGGGVSGQQIQG